uniref:Uncharacterized protein n=1 Tax=Arundo donax TaxID=35708 RepID=A0A0A8XVA4_ARUDO
MKMDSKARDSGTKSYMMGTWN